MASSSTSNINEPMSPLLEDPVSPILTEAEKSEEANRAFYHSEKTYTHANTISTISPVQLLDIRSEFQIPDQYELRSPRQNERMFFRSKAKFIAVHLQSLKYGLRFPLHDFIIAFFTFTGIGLSQLLPNSFIHLLSFIAFCREINHTPSIDFFFSLFTLTKTREPGFRCLNKVSGQKALMHTPSTNKGWHPQWFFVHSSEVTQLPSWSEPMKPTVGFEHMTAERQGEFHAFCRLIPAEAWKTELLSNNQWLFDHGLLLFRPQPQQMPTPSRSPPLFEEESNVEVSPNHNTEPPISAEPLQSFFGPIPKPSTAERPTATAESTEDNTPPLIRKPKKKTTVHPPTTSDPPSASEPPTTTTSKRIKKRGVKPKAPKPRSIHPTTQQTTTTTSEPPSEPPIPKPSRKRDVSQLTSAEKLDLIRQKRQKTPISPTPTPTVTKTPPTEPQTTTSEPPQTTNEPTPPPATSEPPTTSEPPPSTSRPQPFNPFKDPTFQQQFYTSSFWDRNGDHSIPLQLFESFHLPADDSSFNNLPSEDLLECAMIQQGRFLSLFSRILVRNANGESSEQKIEALEKQLAESQANNNKLSADLNHSQQLNQTLQHQNTHHTQQLSELTQQTTDLQQQLLECQRQTEALEQINRTELEHHTKTEQQQRHQIADLQTQLTSSLQEIHEKNKEIVRVNEVKKRGYEEHKRTLEHAKKLKGELDALKASRKTKHIIAKYRASEELAQEIAAEFTKGYRDAMLKVKASGTDLKEVGFSEDDLLFLEDVEVSPANHSAETEPSNQPTNQP